MRDPQGLRDRTGRGRSAQGIDPRSTAERSRQPPARGIRKIDVDELRYSTRRPGGTISSEASRSPGSRATRSPTSGTGASDSCSRASISSRRSPPSRTSSFRCSSGEFLRGNADDERRSCSPGSGCPNAPSIARPSCPEARCSVSRSPAPSPWNPTSCSPTSPREISTPTPAPTSWACFPICGNGRTSLITRPCRSRADRQDRRDARRRHRRRRASRRRANARPLSGAFPRLTERQSRSGSASLPAVLLPRRRPLTPAVLVISVTLATIEDHRAPHGSPAVAAASGPAALA